MTPRAPVSCFLYSQDDEQLEQLVAEQLEQEDLLLEDGEWALDELEGLLPPPAAPAVHHLESKGSN